MKVTIITAVYNSEKTVGDAIKSVDTQTYPNIEHLIIEGKSSDQSLKVIAEHHHDRMTTYSESDSGIYEALNKGLERASGDIIGFVHSDDFLAHDDVINNIVNCFTSDHVQAVYGDLDYISQQDIKKIIRRWSTGAFSSKRLKRGWMPAHPTLYLRKSIYYNYGYFDTKFKIAADYDFILRIFSQFTNETVYLSNVLYKMRVGGISNKNFKRIRQKMIEDYTVLRRNKVGSFGTLAMKNLSKLSQFKT